MAALFRAAMRGRSRRMATQNSVAMPPHPSGGIGDRARKSWHTRADDSG